MNLKVSPYLIIFITIYFDCQAPVEKKAAFSGSRGNFKLSVSYFIFRARFFWARGQKDADEFLTVCT